MTDTNDLGHVHRFLPRSGDTATLLMLHGTGADENDLIPLAQALRPGAAILSPRGNVLEHGMPRFFRRIAEGVFDQEDLARRTDDLASFIENAAARYDFDVASVIAVGFSNGANIAGSLLLRRPRLLKAAMLLSPMIPFEPEVPTDLSGVRVFIGAGRNDPIVPVKQVERLSAILGESGAAVTVHLHDGGHTTTNSELTAARQWIND